MSDRDPRDKMAKSTSEVREEAETLWTRFRTAFRKWLATAFRPVPEGECPNCAKERKRADHWMGVADKHAEKHRASEAALAKALEKPAPSTPVIGGAEDGLVSWPLLEGEHSKPGTVGIAQPCVNDAALGGQARSRAAELADMREVLSAADRQAKRREQYAAGRVGKPVTNPEPEPPAPTGPITYEQVVAMQEPKPPPVVTDEQLDRARQTLAPGADSWGRVRRPVDPLVQTRGEIRQREIIAARDASHA